MRLRHKGKIRKKIEEIALLLVEMTHKPYNKTYVYFEAHQDEPTIKVVGPRFNNTEQILNFNTEIGRKFNVIISQENIHHYIVSAKK